MKGFGLVSIIIVVAIAVGSVAGGWYLYNTLGDNSQSTEAQLESQQTEQTDNQDDGGMRDRGSIIDLLSMNATLQCDFNYTDTEANAVMNGSGYFAGDKMRVDFTSNYADTTQSGSMIKNGGYLYIWGDGMDQGIKMQIDPEDVESSLGEYLGDQETTALNPNQEVDYNCNPWIANSSRFDVPADIQFMDLTSTMQNLQENLEQTTDGQEVDLCAVCNALPADQQATCKAQLECQ